MRTSHVLGFLLVAGLLPAAANAQRGNAVKPVIPERAVRRNLPLTNMIRRAHAAATRDSTGRPGRNYWQLWLDYTINARFDAATTTVTGSEAIVLNNTSNDSLPQIVLRLDQNIFAPNTPRAEVMPDVTDGMKVMKITVDGQPVNLNPPPGRGGGAGLAQPVATNLGQTVAAIRLPKPIPAKGSARIEIDWNFRVPKVEGQRGLRMGAWGDSLVQIAQWYPRVAVYDDLRGWDTEPYLGPSEFYNNYGHFDLKIDAPAGWIVGATGVLQNPQDVLTPTARERLSHALDSDSQRTVVGADERGPGRATAAGDRLVWHFVADTVSDVAWAASRSYVWDATRANIPGKGYVPVNILYLPGHYTNNYQRVGQLTRHALEFYSKLWMPYAFPTMTVVDGPDTGMEYPMFIMSAAGAADHETGHQWWPMMVGVNETWYGFMDEGFNQYMNMLSAADNRNQPPNLNGAGQQYGRISGAENEGPLMWNANFGGPMYGFQAYSKAPLMLSMLGGVVGDSAVWRAQSDYAKAWRFKHPTPWDYMYYMSNALKQDLGWFWYYWLFSTEAVHGSIANVTNAGTRTTVTVRQDGEMPSPVVLKVEFAATGPAVKGMPNSRMQDSVTAIVTYPVDVWFPGSRTFNATLDFGARKIEKITLDPFGRFPDRDITDNIWPRVPAAPPKTD